MKKPEHIILFLMVLTFTPLFFLLLASRSL